MIVLSVIIFVVGYLFITLEGLIKMNKTATALITGIVLWGIYLNQAGSHTAQHLEDLGHEMGKIGEILFFSSWCNDHRRNNR